MDSSQAKLFIGKHADYYLFKWSKLADAGRAQTWNWAAFFFSIGWLAYRKMYTHTFIFMFLWFLIIAVDLIAAPRPTFLLTSNVFVPLLIGLLGNRIYHFHVNDQLIKIYATNLSEKEMQQLMKVRGGTDFSLAFISCVGFVIVLYLLACLLNLIPDFLLPVNLIHALFT